MEPFNPLYEFNLVRFDDIEGQGYALATVNEVIDDGVLQVKVSFEKINQVVTLVMGTRDPVSKNDQIYVFTLPNGLVIGLVQSVLPANFRETNVCRNIVFLNHKR